MATGDKHFPSGGGGDYEAVTASGPVSVNDASYMVDTSEGAVTLTVGSGVDHFTVFDSHFNFGMNNCTVDFGSSTTKVLSLDGEIVTFFKDADDAWRHISVSVGSGGAV